MPKRQPVDTDYVVFSPFLKAVGTEMGVYSITSNDVAMIKQAEQMGLSAQECATVLIRNRKQHRVRRAGDA